MNVIAGLAVGALVGLLMGLSASPVVASAVSALLAIVVTFLGFDGGAGPVRFHAGPRKLAAFSVALALFMVLGVMARTHQWLAPDPRAQLASWVEAGYEENEARRLVAFERLGLLPAGTERPEPSPHSGVLFGSEGRANCGTLEGERFESSRDRLAAMVTRGPPWDGLEAVASRLDDDGIAQLTEAAWQIGCAE